MTSSPSHRVVSIYARASRSADGVADHARLLSARLEASGYEASIITVDWRAEGWGAVKEGFSNARARDPDLIVLHYSHLGWSRRGLPLGTIRVARRASRLAPTLLWVHDPGRIEGSQLRQRLGSFAKGLGLRFAARLVKAVVVTVHPSHVYWLSKSREHSASFCPSPSNFENATRDPPSDRFTVACFGIGLTENPLVLVRLQLAARRLARRLGGVRIRILGENAPIPRELFRRLESAGVELDVPGTLPTSELLLALARSHVFLHVRGPLTSRSGTLAAALSCGLPIIGIASQETGPPLLGTGPIIVSDSPDEIAETLGMLAEDSALQQRLAAKSLTLYGEHYSWDGACEIVERALHDGRVSGDHRAGRR